MPLAAEHIERKRLKEKRGNVRVACLHAIQQTSQSTTKVPVNYLSRVRGLGSVAGSRPHHHKSVHTTYYCHVGNTATPGNSRLPSSRRIASRRCVRSLCSSFVSRSSWMDLFAALFLPTTTVLRLIRHVSYASSSSFLSSLYARPERFTTWAVWYTFSSW